MRSNIRDTSLPCIPFDDQPETLARQSFTMMIKEQRLLIGMALHQARASQFQVFLRGLYCNRGKRQDTLTLASPVTTRAEYRCALRIKILKIDRNKLAHAHPRCIQHL